MAYPIFQYMEYRVFGVVIQLHLWSKFIFMTYCLLEATLNGFIRDFFFFFTINLFSLTTGEAASLYHNRHHC